MQPYIDHLDGPLTTLASSWISVVLPLRVIDTGPYRALCDDLERLPETTLLLPGLPAISAIWYNEMSQFAMMKSIAKLTVTAVFVLS
jgi:hypothetical protein